MKRNIVYPNKEDLDKAKRSRERQEVVYPDARQETDESKERNRQLKRERKKKRK